MAHNRCKSITALWLITQLKGQKYKCAISGRPITEMDCEVDHILPSSRGGSDELDNLRLVCPAANRAKTYMTDEELVILCREILKTLGGEHERRSIND